MENSKKYSAGHFTFLEGLFFLTSFLIFCLPKALTAQQDQEKKLIIFSGKVVESDRKKPVPDVQIISKNNLVGTFSRESGDFDLLVTPGDSLLFSRLGYVALCVAVTDSLLSLDRLPIFYLKTDTIQMHEVIIRGYPNYQMLKLRIAAMKPKDRPYNIVDYRNDNPLLYLKPNTGVSVGGPVQLLYDLFNAKAVMQRKLVRNRKRYNRNMIRLGKIQDTIPAIPDYMREKIR